MQYYLEDDETSLVVKRRLGYPGAGDDHWMVVPVATVEVTAVVCSSHPLQAWPSIARQLWPPKGFGLVHWYCLEIASQSQSPLNTPHSSRCLWPPPYTTHAL